eukprot:SAG11_NODE_4367_length_1931_cov_1.400655_1_plen_96_part_00
MTRAANAPNEAGYTPLMVACYKATTAARHAGHRRGAKGDCGGGPLPLGSGDGCALVRALLALLGLDVNAVHCVEGTTALHYAAGCGHTEALRLVR